MCIARCTLIITKYMFTTFPRYILECKLFWLTSLIFKYIMIYLLRMNAIAENITAIISVLVICSVDGIADESIAGFCWGERLIFRFLSIHTHYALFCRFLEQRIYRLWINNNLFLERRLVSDVPLSKSTIKCFV